MIFCIVHLNLITKCKMPHSGNKFVKATIGTNTLLGRKKIKNWAKPKMAKDLVVF